MLILEGYLRCNKTDLPRLLAALAEHIALSRQEPGCVSFDVSQDAQDKLLFHVQEAFHDRKAFDAHQQRVAASHWGNVSKNAERHYQLREQNDLHK